MQAPKITVEERAELIRLHREGNRVEMKALSARLGVSPYYGAVLSQRQLHPYQRSRRKWHLAAKAGPVLA